MVKTDALEGIVNETLRFHYDMFADVLYLRRVADEQTPAYGEINDDGDIVLRSQATDEPIGLTVVSWWKRFGQGPLPDSINEIQRHIEPLTQRLAT